MRAMALRRMLVLEAAAAGWFDRLGEHEREAYLRAHPKSKFNTAGHRLVPEDDHAIAASHHERLRDLHTAIAERGGPGAAEHHKIAHMHDQARVLNTEASTALLRDRSSATKTALRASRAANSATRHHIFDGRRGDAEKTPIANAAPSAAKRPRGVRVHESGIELHPIDHPDAWRGGYHHMYHANKTVPVRAFALHKNGQRIGTVHSVMRTVDHMIPNSRLRSHSTNHIVYRLKLDPQHVREGLHVPESFNSLSSAVERAEGDTKGTSRPRAAQKGAVDHVAHAAAHREMAEKVAKNMPAYQPSRRTDLHGARRYQALNSLRWAHHGAAEAHELAERSRGTAHYDQRLADAVKATSQARSKSSRAGLHFEIKK